MTALSLRLLVASLAIAGATVTTSSQPRQTAALTPGTPPCDVQTTARVVAIADIHGAYDRFVKILRKAELIDADLHWSGGKSVFLQLGDMTDRGPDSRKVMDLLRRMQSEAPKDGGLVIPLLGNHEVMRMIWDFRYVSPGEYAAFETPDSTRQRELYIEALTENSRKDAAEARRRFDEKAFARDRRAETPLGLVEMAAAFGAEGTYGKWLLNNPVIATVNGVAFLHGGTTRAVAAMGCKNVNARAKTELRTLLKMTDVQREESLIWSQNGPLWFRGLAYDKRQDLPDGMPLAAMLKETEVDQILELLGVRAIVIGHTVAEDAKVRWKFNNRVVQLDSGMLDGNFFPGGSAAALEIVGDTFTMIYENRREVLGPPHTAAIAPATAAP